MVFFSPENNVFFTDFDMNIILKSISGNSQFHFISVLFCFKLSQFHREIVFLAKPEYTQRNTELYNCIEYY